MALDNIERRVVYEGDGSLKDFPFSFVVFKDSDITVSRSIDENRDETVATTEYSVELSDDGTGTVHFVEAPAEGIRIAILSAVPETQPMKLTTYDGFDPEVLNDSADRIVALIQQLLEKVQRAVILSPTDPMSANTLRDRLFQAAKEALESAQSAEEALAACEQIRQLIEQYSWDIPHIVDSIRDVENYPYDGLFAVAGFGNAGGKGQNISNRYVKAEGSTELRTLGERFADVVNVKDFGARGDGTTDDTEAIQAAVNCAAKKGCRVFMPATGAAYVTNDSILVKRGVSVFGDSHNGYNGSAESNAEYAKAGTTVNPKGTNGSAFILEENGASVGGIQFVHDQPLPTDTNWAPIQYPYCIEARASWHTIKDISVVNGTHGIWLSYTPEAPGGTQVTIDNCRLGALEVGLRHDSLTDTLAVTRVNFAPSWQIDNPTVKAYRHNHTIGWMLGHGSGTYVDGVEFYRLKTAMQLRSLENNVGGDTGARAARFDNILFNLVNKAVELTDTNLITQVNFGTVYAQSTDDWGLSLGSDALFDLNSNNADFSFERLYVGTCGGRVFTVGAGEGGILNISNLYVNSYGARSNGQSAIYIDTGAKVKIGTYTIKKSSTSGSYFSGGGASALVTASKRTKVFFPVFNAVTITGTGQAQHISTDDPGRSTYDGWTQMKLHINVNITSAVSGVATFSFGGVSVVVDTSSTGWKEVDSNWVDIAEDAANQSAGRLMATAPNGAVLSTGSCYAQWR